eukprot:CAMPEP_0198326590 /NCGR_PEP_ID=MMETSP1450-20131203/14086_1 /TAXON_ID=753684 ORGANISM="Madagascaria erythrocladiodes, Strain CCMP3234" /NCGR_SAMPLE_ID=MMETSP1450 /ASSEMBLY_ACC=CAM_ASM_001115 /LENGTH=106 /DNA_ID=CAMNT_0044030565 /DNA_START=103 /DNA_END=420 /DNA_ORIENTATION=-
MSADDAQQARFDGMLLQVAQESGGIEPLMGHFFGMLRRRTDFFTGADKEKAKALVVECFEREHALAARARREQEQRRAAAEKEKEAAKAAADAAKLSPAPAAAAAA